MDSDICEDVLNDGKYLCQPSTSVFNRLKQNCTVVAVNSNAKEHSDREAFLRPITPKFNSESGDCSCTFTSPLTLFPTPPKAIDLDSHLNHGPSSVSEECLHTPEEGVFDSFAPGPDRFMLAPHCRKFIQEPRNSVVRRLHFESFESFLENSDHEVDVGTNPDDRILFELVYRTIMEVILSVQAEGFSAKIMSPDSGCDLFKTPISSPCLSGIAETCPCAPVKPRSKFRNIDKAICRKLDF